MSERAVDPEVLEDADRLGRAISRFVRVVTRVKAGAPTDARGLDVASMRLLSALSENGPQRSNSLAEAVVSDPSTVSRQVANLVRLGMVSRQADEADRRAWVLAVTAAGAEALAQHYAQRESFLAGVIDPWTTEDRKRLPELLDRLSKSMTERIVASDAQT
jgi:DNA-binding MarR family transcriptional regulator